MASSCSPPNQPSAGGHLAAWISGRRAAASVKTAGAGREIRIRSVTLMSAVLDLEFAVTNGRDGFVRKLLGGSPSEVPDRYDFASPIAHLPTGLRVTAVHGDTDRVVALEQSRRYVSAATRTGNAADPACAARHRPHRVHRRHLTGLGHRPNHDPRPRRVPTLSRTGPSRTRSR